MKLALAVAALLFASVAQADSGPAYNISGSADFTVPVTGQNLAVSFSYTLNGSSPNDANATVSNIQFTTSGTFGTFTLFNSSPFDLQWSNTGNPSDGVLFDLNDSQNFPAQVSMSLFDLPADPFGPILPSSATYQVVRAPEASTYAMLIAGIGLVALRRWKKVTC